MEAEVSARADLPEERSSAEDALGMARETLEEYGRGLRGSGKRLGTRALEEAPPPKSSPQTCAAPQVTSSAQQRLRQPDVSPRPVPC